MRKKALRIMMWLVAGVVLLLLLVVIGIQTRPGKNFVREQAAAFLRQKLQTEVQIGELDYALPKMLVLKRVLLCDETQDTLLYAREIKVDIAMLKLLNNHVRIQQVYLDGVFAHIYRRKNDTAFNFSYIVNAFAAPNANSTPAPPDTTTSFTIDLEKLVLQQVRFSMNDTAGGSFMTYEIGNLHLTMKELNPNKMILRLGKLYANNLNAAIIQAPAYLTDAPDTGTAPLHLHLAADELHLNNIRFNQQSLESQFFIDVSLGELLVHPENIDLINQSVALRDFTLNNSNVHILMKPGAAVPAKQVTDTPAEQDLKWRVKAGNLKLNNINFILNDETQPRLPSGIDYAHLNVQGLVLDANDLRYTTDTIAGTIHQLAAKEQSGLDLRRLKTRFEYTPQGAYLRDLHLQTDNTILQNYAAVRYPSLETLASNPHLMQIELNLQESILGMKDLLTLMPELEANPFFRKHRRGMLRMEARMKGRLDNLKLDRLYATGLGNTKVDMNGTIYGLPDINKLRYNLKIAALQSSKHDVQSLLPPATLQQINLPDGFGTTGTISGSMMAYKPNLVIITTDGNASINGYVDMSRGTGKERYDLMVKTRSLNIGKIIRNEEIGTITADLKARGTSFDPPTMNATARANIQSVRFHNYTYRDIILHSKLEDTKATLQLRSNDPNAHLQLNGRASLAGTYPAIYADAVMDSIDLKALHFSSSEMRLRGQLHADIPLLNPDYPQATVTIANTIVTTGGKRHLLDTIYLGSSPSTDSGNNIILRAPSIKAHIWGQIPLTGINDIVQYHIARHYSPADSLTKGNGNHTAPAALPESYHLQFVAGIEDNPILRRLLPDLQRVDNVHIAAELSPKRLQLTADAPQISYLNYDIRDARVSVNGNDSALTYKMSVDRVHQNSIDIYYANVTGRLSANTLTTDISVSDRDSNRRFFLSGVLQNQGNDQVFQLNPHLMLNYENWNVLQPNRITFGEQGFFVENFGINKGKSGIEINSLTPTYNAPLRADISNFLLSSLTQMISQDTLLVDGMLAGNINLQRFSPDPQVTSQLAITHLSVLGDTIGDLDINVRSATENVIDAQLSITGFGNHVTLNGVYYPSPVNGNNFNMTLGLQPLNMATLEGAAQHQIHSTSGFLRGDLQLTGTLDAPLLNGQLRTDELRTTPTLLGAPFYFPGEAIKFTGKNLVLNDFNISDSAGNMATINGKMNFHEMNLAMRLRANNWQAMSSTAKENKDFNGRLFLSTNMNINGQVATPNIDGSLHVLKGTAVNVTIPATEQGIQERDGVVEFADISRAENKNSLALSPDSLGKKTRVPIGSHVNLNVTTDEEASFSVIVDENTGDFVRIRGVANLNTMVMPDGSMGLTGNYEIREGFYQFSYNFIRRKFKVESGSNISFSGDPMKAEMNVTAIYEANVPPYDLVSRQVEDPAELVYFKQRLPFAVKMQITGPIMQPALNFDIVLPEGKSYRVGSEVTEMVQNRLNQLRTQPSELNKQVFALIILNRFVADYPFQNGAGGGSMQTMARQSVSSFVSEQLNKFAGGLIAGLDLTLDLQSSEDYTTGKRRNRTDLNIGASKRLLNDRLTVNVGNNFQLEGPQSNTTRGNSYIPGNITVDYDLSADRRYRMRFFRRDEQPGELEGNVISTGASFILQVDFNRFRQVLMSRKKRQQRMEEKRQEKQQEKERDSVQTGLHLYRKDQHGTH